MGYEKKKVLIVLECEIEEIIEGKGLSLQDAGEAVSNCLSQCQVEYTTAEKNTNINTWEVVKVKEIKDRD